MKLSEIFSFTEALDNPLPYLQISKSSWQIGETLILRVEENTVQDYKISHVSFNIINPPTGKPRLSNAFVGGGASRVFASIIEILKTIPAQDLLLFLPDDVEVEVAHKKGKLYNVILRRLLSSNLVIRIENLHQSTGEHLIAAFPGGSRLWNVENSEIESLIVEYLIQKTT